MRRICFMARDTDTLRWTKKTNAMRRGRGVNNKQGSYLRALVKDFSAVHGKVCFPVEIRHFEWQWDWVLSIERSKRFSDSSDYEGPGTRKISFLLLRYGAGKFTTICSEDDYYELQRFRYNFWPKMDQNIEYLLPNKSIDRNQKQLMHNTM